MPPPAIPASHWPTSGASGRARSLIRRTWDSAREVEGIARIIVATDDTQIADAATAFGAEVMMTSDSCRNGTERCAEVAERLGSSVGIVVNLQGDAPLTPPWFIRDLVAAMRDRPDCEVATPVLRCDSAALGLHRGSSSRPGGRDDRRLRPEQAGALLLQGSHPYTGRTLRADETIPVFHHVGVYAYRPQALLSYGSWEPGPWNFGKAWNSCDSWRTGRRSSV